MASQNPLEFPYWNPFGSFTGADPLEWWRGGYEWLRCSARLQEMWLERFSTPSERQTRRAARLSALLAHARAHSPYLARHWQGIPVDAPLQALPPTGKAALMAHFDDWVTDPTIHLRDVRRFVDDPARIGESWLGRFAVWTSSGTSGIPGIFIQDEEALAVYGALLSARLSSAPGADPQALTLMPQRFALVAATGGHFAGLVWWERLRRRYPMLAAQMRVFSILAPLDEIRAGLAEWNPASIASYPTVLRQLADEQRAGRLRIAPHTLWSGGEMLSDTDRRFIEESFGCAVVEDYGASECLNIAHACRERRLHLHDNWVVLEPVDAQMRPVAPGEASHTVLVTNLANRVQPIVRYDLGDSVTIDPDPCPCGNPCPTMRVGGRADDMLEFRDSGGQCVRVLPLAIETVLEEQCSVPRFQLTQTAHDELHLRIDSEDALARLLAFERAHDALLRFLVNQGATAPIRLHLDEGTPETERASGKLRRIRAAR